MSKPSPIRWAIPLGRASPLRSALERAGYEVGFTNGTGATPLDGEVDRFDILLLTIF
jgi:hypothetical protein